MACIPAEEVTFEGSTAEILAQLATLTSLGTAVNKLGSLEVFDEGWKKDCATILKGLMGSGLAQITAIGTTAVDNTAIDRAAAHEATAQQTCY